MQHLLSLRLSPGTFLHPPKDPTQNKGGSRVSFIPAEQEFIHLALGKQQGCSCWALGSEPVFLSLVLRSLFLRDSGKRGRTSNQEAPGSTREKSGRKESQGKCSKENLVRDVLETEFLSRVKQRNSVFSIGVARRKSNPALLHTDPQGAGIRH